MNESPVLACSLAADDYAERAAEFRSLVDASLRRERTELGGRLRLANAPGLGAAVEDLARRERECCPFLDIRVLSRGDEIWLEVDAPAEVREATVRSLLGA